ncbi:LPXTG-site transpeptidase (sortase) family protein [Bacillus sp. V-88]|uniref:Sortase n=1 Tax=Rossellomorea vietnamensis TaxID=218284 RepID=A0A6I6UDU5_9BACI|nr:class F sortase [Rossellomorea vietnamensis]OXS64343.1 sortase [Bacillus sp. DSM 27956]PRX79480.1 LPXTG-site transpeptidase (sortase) family protein [Bacillus sp. V-88]QHE60128.1 sortase [Rossellomorea vietnamensis]SLJ95671.1 LPXTG-site transpeptidase (sortase) family protein [Bacillus sp. V-88]
MYTMRVVLLVLVLLPISACSAGISSNPTEEKAKTSNGQEEPVTQMASTTTSPSQFADTIIKDERSGIVPATIEIPAIDVSTSIEAVGLKENGEMAVTESFETTAWYQGGYKPGEPGNAVIGGHVDSRNGPAVFYKLNKLSKGDEIIVKNKEGEKRTFVVIDKKEYPWDDAPLKSIFGYSPASSLNLITCTGDFDHSARNYSKRLVVYTELKS